MHQEVTSRHATTGGDNTRVSVCHRPKHTGNKEDERVFYNLNKWERGSSSIIPLPFRNRQLKAHYLRAAALTAEDGNDLWSWVDNSTLSERA